MTNSYLNHIFLMVISLFRDFKICVTNINKIFIIHVVTEIIASKLTALNTDSYTINREFRYPIGLLCLDTLT